MGRGDPRAQALEVQEFGRGDQRPQPGVLLEPPEAQGQAMLALQPPSEALSLLHMPQQLSEQHVAGRCPRAPQARPLILHWLFCFTGPFHPAEQRHGGE